jgi:Porin subfamily
MKLVQSLLLGAAAGIVTMSGASAADLAVTKPAPAEYVRVCSAEGSGFFYIPGTETCLSISGRVRFDVAFTSDLNGRANPGEDFGYDFRTSARLNFDTRTATSLGTLRGFARLELNDSGSVTPDQVFISLGGFTVGRLDSLYGFDDPGYARLGTTEQMQYIATFGSGFFVGAAVEDTDPNFSSIFSQDINGVVAFGYVNGGTKARLAARYNTLDVWGVQLQAQQSLDSGTTIFGAASFEDKNGPQSWSVTLKFSQKFSDQFSANIGGAYEDYDAGFFGGADAGDGAKYKITAGVDYTVVPGFVIGPEVVYENFDNPGAVNDYDAITGRMRFQRNF